MGRTPRAIAVGATTNWVAYDQIGTGARGTANVGNLQNGAVLDGITGNSVSYDLLAYNGGAGVLFDNGSNPGNNSLVGDTFTITVH